jgi:hypothetical protein
VAGLRIERDGGTLRITLARPERRNAFDAELIADLTEAFADVGDARAVVLAGDGPSFCAGADIEWQRSAIDLSLEENAEDALRLYTGEVQPAGASASAIRNSPSTPRTVLALPPRIAAPPATPRNHSRRSVKSQARTRRVAGSAQPAVVKTTHGRCGRASRNL